MVKLERPVLYMSGGGSGSSDGATRYYEHIASSYVVLAMPLGVVCLAWVDMLSERRHLALDRFVLVGVLEGGYDYLWQRYAFRVADKDASLLHFRPFHWSHRGWVLSPYIYSAVMYYFPGVFEDRRSVVYWCYGDQYDLVNRVVGLLECLGYGW